MDLRTVLAAVLGVGLGLVLIAYPGAIISIQTAGRMPHDRGGEYGQGTGAPDSWRRLVQGVGVLLVLGGLYFGWTLVG